MKIYSNAVDGYDLVMVGMEVTGGTHPGHTLKALPGAYLSFVISSHLEAEPKPNETNQTALLDFDGKYTSPFDYIGIALRNRFSQSDTTDVYVKLAEPITEIHVGKPLTIKFITPDGNASISGKVKRVYFI